MSNLLLILLCLKLEQVWVQEARVKVVGFIDNGPIACPYFPQ